MLLPGLAMLAWLVLYPIGDAIHLSLTDWDGFSAPRSIGLKNFSELVNDPRFKEALLHNLAIAAALPIWIGLPYAIAWRLHAKMWGWRFFRFAFFLPVVFSPAVIGIYYGIVLKPEGPLNSALDAVGLSGLARSWLNDPSLTLPVVIAILIWASFGVGVLIFLSALSSLDREQIDAARIEGANGWQIQRHVVFWQLLPVVEFWAVIIVISSFTAVFPLIYTLTKGGPGTSTYTLDYFLYVEAFTSGRLGYASAVGVASLVIIVAVSLPMLALFRWRRA